MKLKEDFIGHLGGILVPFFGLRFSVDFSPLFGLRAFGKLLVLLYFFALEGGFATTFRPVFDRPFAQDGVPVFEVLFLQGVARLKLSRVSRGRIYSSRRVSYASSACFMRPGCWFSTLWDPMDVFRSLIESWF